MAHKELNLRERRVIEDILNAKISVREIAAEIGRHVSTVALSQTLALDPWVQMDRRSSH